MANESILIVEDEEDIQELIRYNLAKEGYDVRVISSGEKALETIRRNRPEMVLLDLMLPGIDGLEVCRQLKRAPEFEHLPIVIVSAKGEESDVVAGLELGADDYITKPFSPKVLIARVRTIFRRGQAEAVDTSAPLQHHDLTIHPGRRECLLAGSRIDLTFTEFQLLHFLALRPGWVFTRKQIVDAIRGDDYPVTDRSVDVVIAGLRKKLGSAGEYIETVRGVGYRFKE